MKDTKTLPLFLETEIASKINSASTELISEASDFDEKSIKASRKVRGKKYYFSGKTIKPEQLKLFTDSA